MSSSVYNPLEQSLLTFHNYIPNFCNGKDTPRDYLERCLEKIDLLEPKVNAFVVMNIESARSAADASSKRYRDGKPLSIVDGMPFGVKDLYETIDMKTQMNSPVYEDWEGIRDSAHAFVLRKGGSVILGKTATTEFGMASPPPTRNPFNYDKTAGGSSSGSSAAVGASMIPAASGSQVRGSIVRPAGYCANFALKPTFGAINRGGGHSLAPSQSVLGVHAGSLEDCWSTAFYISSQAGGDAGCPGLFGNPTIEKPIKPDKIIRIDSIGWDSTTDSTKEAFEGFLQKLITNGVEIISRKDDERVEKFEEALYEIPDYLFRMLAYESRWPLQDYNLSQPGTLSQKMLDSLELGLSVSVEDYRLILKRRQKLRDLQKSVSEIAGSFLLLCSCDPPPDYPYIGDPVYGDVSSTLGAPSFSLPFLEVEGLPVGVQYMGFPGDDYRIASHSKWMIEVLKGK
ncbi:MAG: amidase [Nitrospinota bacterium]|nr:amidase [Nitrospinota bacterium]